MRSTMCTYCPNKIIPATYSKKCPAHFPYFQCRIQHVLLTCLAVFDSATLLCTSYTPEWRKLYVAMHVRNCLSSYFKSTFQTTFFNCKYLLVSDLWNYLLQFSFTLFPLPLQSTFFNFVSFVISVFPFKKNLFFFHFQSFLDELGNIWQWRHLLCLSIPVQNMSE